MTFLNKLLAGACKHFLVSPVFIDYTYLWDLVCKPKNEGGVLLNEGMLNGQNVIVLVVSSDSRGPDFRASSRKSLT